MTAWDTVFKKVGTVDSGTKTEVKLPTTGLSQPLFVSTQVTKITEPRYSIGQRFQYQDGMCTPETFLLARVKQKVVLICMESGEPWGKPVRVDHMWAITEKEFKKITDDSYGIYEFTLINEEDQ